MRKRTAGMIGGIFLTSVFAVFISCGDGNGNIKASGTIESQPVTISAKMGGDVREIKVDEGSRVKKGDVLAIIDNRAAELKLRQAEKNLALTESELSLVSGGARIEDIEQAQAAYEVADSTYRSAEEDFRRMTALFETGSITKKQRDDAEAARTIARARLDGARQNLAKIRNLARPEEVRAALIKRDLGRIAVELAEEELGYTTITAPIAGVVTHRLVENGELVFQGSALFSITDLSAVDLTIYVTEVNLARVKIGQEARVTIDAFPAKQFSGKVTYISPEAEFTPKNVQTKEDRVKLVFAVKIRIPNQDETLKPGLPADAELMEPEGGA